jgi:hypothetical protein
MKITGKTLMVNFETEVKLGNNNAIELTLVHQAFISKKNSGELDIDVDMSVDITNVKFLGVAIKEGFNEYKEFKKSLLNLGIDLNKLIDEKENELINKGIKDKLEFEFRDEL